MGFFGKMWSGIKSVGSTAAKAVGGLASGAVDMLGSLASVLTDEYSKDKAHDRATDSAWTQANIQTQNAKMAAELARKKAELDAKLAKELEERKAELERERMELAAKLEQNAKDKDLEREIARKQAEFEYNQNVMNEILRYKKELYALLDETLANLGNLSLDLRAKAHDLVIEKTKQYKQIQDEATQKAMSEIELIEEKFAGNERAKDMLYRASDKKLMVVMEGTEAFIKELNDDIKRLSASFDVLAQIGQRSIENHLIGASPFQIANAQNAGAIENKGEIIDTEQA